MVLLFIQVKKRVATGEDDIMTRSVDEPRRTRWWHERFSLRQKQQRKETGNDKRKQELSTYVYIYA